MSSKSHKAFLFTAEALLGAFLVIIALLSLGNKSNVSLDEELKKQIGIDALVVCREASNANDCLEFANEQLKGLEISFDNCNGSIARISNRKACLHGK